MEENQQQVPQQPIMQTPPAPRKSNILLMSLGAVVLLGLGLVGGYFLFGNKSQSSTSTIQKYSQISPTSEVQTSPTKSNTIYDEYTSQKLSLYKLELMIPNKWTLKEVNKRPEPTGPGDPIKDHDCADYQIISDDKYVSLLIKPTCGFLDGAPTAWPSDAVIVKAISNSQYIIRYFDKNKSSYMYADAYMTPQKLNNHILVIGEGDDSIFIDTTLKYTGPANNTEQYLRKVDGIINSIKKS